MAAGPNKMAGPYPLGVRDSRARGRLWGPLRNITILPYVTIHRHDQDECNSGNVCHFLYHPFSIPNLPIDPLSTKHNSTFPTITFLASVVAVGGEASYDRLAGAKWTLPGRQREGDLSGTI